MPSGRLGTLLAGRLATRIARTALVIAVLAMPLYAAACAPKPSTEGEARLCALAQQVAGEADHDATTAGSEYDQLAFDWSSEDPPPFGDRTAQTAATDLTEARGDAVAYGTAKKHFDYYVLEHCGFDVSSAGFG